MAAPDRGQASTLTGVFAPGAPALFETLRTLAITPRRVVTPGETIRAEFAFSNLGGAPATGVRVRFSLPPGVTHVEGSDTVDDEPLPEGESFIAAGGAPLGNVAPNSQRRIATSYRVNTPIEDGTELLFQAVLATEQTALVASNAERLSVRSAPVLANASTYVTIAAPNEPKPGDTVTVRATIANTGESSAHDVMAILPVPEHTTFVGRSARVAGRTLTTETEPFDYSSEAIVAPRLAPGQSVIVEYQATIDAPLPDGSRIKAAGAVAAREIPEFAIESAEIVVSSPVDFDNDETQFVLHCDDVVVPGSLVPVTLRLANTGTGNANNVNVRFDLPQGLIYTPGSARLDGQPISDASFADARLDLGALAAGRIVEVAFSVVVGLPGAGEAALPVGAVVRWRGGERHFGRQLRVRASSRFTRARNYIEVDRSVVQSREEIVFVARIFNDGTASEGPVRLRVLPGAFLERVRVAEPHGELRNYDEPFDLGVIEPHEERMVRIQATVSSPVPDRTQITLGGVLEFAASAFDLGVASVIARSRPQVVPERCNWEIASPEPIRPHQTRDVVIRFTNDGSDALREARMQISIPPELAIERTENARRDGNVLHFGEVGALDTHEARIVLRLLRPPRRENALRIEGVLYGRGISPLEFPPLELPAFAEPSFDENAELRSNPQETINAGERIAYEIRLENSGDGPAERLVVRVIPTNLAVYVPSSTTLNGMTIPVDLGISQLWSQRGLMLTDVNPGVDLHLRWEMIVMSPLTEGTPIEARAVVEWDGERSLALSAPSLRVVSAPSLAASSAGTPISVAQMVQLEVPRAENILPPPPEPADAEPQAAAEPARVAPLIEQAAVSPEPVESAEPAATSPTMYLDLAREDLAQTIETIEKSDAGGLVQHLFALRALLPNAIVGANDRDTRSLIEAARTARAPLDRFFVRLRVPRLTITSKDLEDRESRDAMRDIVDIVSRREASPAKARPPEIVRMRGPVDVDILRQWAPQLATAPLGSVVPWILNAQMLGTTIEYNGGSTNDALAAYRSEMIRVFTLLETLPMPEFHRVLGSSVNRTLDETLGNVLAALRDAAHVAVQ